MQKFIKINFFPILILTVLLSQQVSAQTYNCNYCGKAIQGEYIKVEGLYFHPNHFICAKCGKVIEGSYNKKDNKFFHSKCFAEMFLGKCSYCNKLIEGEYYEQGGKKYHVDCYQKFVALKCSICGELINGSYYTDYFGNKFHSYHENEYHKCDNCHRLITDALTGGGIQLSDGRYICHQCERFAVEEQKKIRSIAETVLRKLKNSGFKIDLSRVDIFSVDRDELKRITGSNYQSSMRGYCLTKVEERGNKKTFSHKIYVLNYAPSIYIESTLAHEFMHVWINENTELEHSGPFREGSCNYLSYIYLKQNYSKESEVLQKILMDDPSRDYGEGFRQVLKKVNGKPLSYLFTLLANHKSI